MFQRREATGGTQAVPGVPSTTDPNDPSNQPQKSADWESKVVNPYGRRSLLVPAWYRGVSLIMQTDRKSTRLNSSHTRLSRMPSSA